MNILEKLEEMRDFYSTCPISMSILEKKLGVSKSTISRFVNGKKISLDSFEGLAKLYDLYEDNLEKMLLELLGEQEK